MTRGAGGWRSLADADWAAHPLNRYRGWLLALVVLHLAAVFGLLAYASAILTGWRDVLLYTSPGANWLVFGAGAIQAAVFLVGAGYRWRYTAEATLAAVVFARWTQLGLDVSAFPDDAAIALDYELSLVFWAVVFAYLFFGRRPNVMFRRRERVESGGG